MFFLALAANYLPAQGQLSETAAWAATIADNYRIVPDITYSVANNYELKLDVYAPRATAGPNPTLLFIHGGGWVTGSKESAQMWLMPYFEMGWAVVNVEYRLAKVSLAPAAVEDCRMALRWIFLHAKEYGFDTTKVVVTGGSAGGHLALTTGVLTSSAGFDHPLEWSTQRQSIKVAAIINWYGITDVVDLLADPNTMEYALSWFGSMSNREEMAKRVSPLTYVRKDLPPILTIHGTADQLVPYSHATRLHEALTKAGVPNQLVTIPNGRHGGFTREEMLKIYATIREFLGKYNLMNGK